MRRRAGERDRRGGGARAGVAPVPALRLVRGGAAGLWRHARTLIVERDGAPALALPFVGLGPEWLGLAQVPGCYWPFRSFPVREAAPAAVDDAALARLARQVRGLRIGPVYDGDASVAPLIAAARARGLGGARPLRRRQLPARYRRARAARARGRAPRRCKKNRFHEKHLGGHGALDWSFVSGKRLGRAAFDALAEVERASWIADAHRRHATRSSPRAATARFWRAAAADPVIAEMMWAAVLRVDGRPAAFSFDMNAGALKYAIANSYDPPFAKHSPGKLLYYRNLVRGDRRRHRRRSTGARATADTSGRSAPTQGPAIRDWLLLRPGIAGACRAVARGAVAAERQSGLATRWQAP